MSVRDEINKYSAEEDRSILHWLLDHYRWRSQWSFVASFKFHRYGPKPYETNRGWVPTVEGRILYENMAKNKGVNENER